MHQYRTHTCNELTAHHVGQSVKLSGWIHRIRDHGNVAFIDLRDHYGITQLVFFDTSQIHNLRLESVITVIGNVVARGATAINDKIYTGGIELNVQECNVESCIQALLPMVVNGDQDIAEDTRLKYRFLDLRREQLHKNIIMRSHVIQKMRELMIGAGFLEFQTPILTSSSPEGARDFLVPSRLHPGQFYALPQAPQQFKQLLMISGFDKYFQIAPCFRDEDARADRAPGEFYQLDVEMSFVTQEDVFRTIEPIIREIFTTFSTKIVANEPFARIPYDIAMLKYGSDKPDLRNPIEISDVTDIFHNSGLSIFNNAITKGAVVRAIPAMGSAKNPRSFFDSMIEFAKKEGASGLAYIQLEVKDGVLEAYGPIAKFIDKERIAQIQQRTNTKDSDVIFFICDIGDRASKLAGKVRTEIGQKLNLIKNDSFKFCWIVDFPFYEWNDHPWNKEAPKIDFCHNPFSMPQGGLEILQNSTTREELLAIKAYQYDLVCNGVELSSGAIRNHKPEIMYKAFEIAGYDRDVVDQKFGAMINAFKYGAPPHGGIAPGVDRIVMLLAQTDNIREVIAFPMNQQARDLLMNAPSTVSEQQLKDLHITGIMPSQ